MCKNAVFILHFCSSRGPVSLRKEKPRKPLEEYGGYRKTFLCPTTGTPPVPPYFGAVAAARQRAPSALRLPPPSSRAYSPPG